MKEATSAKWLLFWIAMFSFLNGNAILVNSKFSFASLDTNVAFGVFET